MHCCTPFDHIFLCAGVEQAVQKRDSLDGKQKYAAYVAMHTLCMSRGGKFLWSGCLEYTKNLEESDGANC